MEDVAAVRRAAQVAIDDVQPDSLRARIADRLADASLTPGVLTLVSARAVREGAVESLAERAAGVQLIYEGLALTRRLARTDAWSGPDADAADLDILVADILVARGFYLLARTEAAGAAVGVVRAFGTDETVRAETGDGTGDWTLESDVLELSVVAGTAAAGAHTPARLREFASELARDGLPQVGEVQSREVTETLARLTPAEPAPTDGLRTSADH